MLVAVISESIKFNLSWVTRIQGVYSYGPMRYWMIYPKILVPLFVYVMGNMARRWVLLIYIDLKKVDMRV